MHVASVSGEIKHFAGLDIPSYGHAMFVVRHQLRGAFCMRDRVSYAIAAAAAAVGEVARIRVFHPPARRRVRRVAQACNHSMVLLESIGICILWLWFSNAIVLLLDAVFVLKYLLN